MLKNRESKDDFEKRTKNDTILLIGVISFIFVGLLLINNLKQPNVSGDGNKLNTTLDTVVSNDKIEDNSIKVGNIENVGGDLNIGKN